MKCQSLFSGKILRKILSICPLLNLLRVVNAKANKVYLILHYNYILYFEKHLNYASVKVKGVNVKTNFHSK